MSLVTNEARKRNSWFSQFSKSQALTTNVVGSGNCKCGTDSVETMSSSSGSSGGQTWLWQRAFSLRRSLGKSQQRKHKISVSCLQNSGIARSSKVQQPTRYYSSGEVEPAPPQQPKRRESLYYLSSVVYYDSSKSSSSSASAGSVSSGSLQGVGTPSTVASEPEVQPPKRRESLYYLSSALYFDSSKSSSSSGGSLSGRSVPERLPAISSEVESQQRPKRQGSYCYLNNSALYYDSSKSSCSTASGGSTPGMQPVNTVEMESPPPPPLPPKLFNKKSSSTLSKTKAFSSSEDFGKNSEKLIVAKENLNSYSNVELKAIQKRAVLEFYLKHRKSEEKPKSDNPQQRIHRTSSSKCVLNSHLSLMKTSDATNSEQQIKVSSNKVQLVVSPRNSMLHSPQSMSTSPIAEYSPTLEEESMTDSPMPSPSSVHCTQIVGTSVQTSTCNAVTVQSVAVNVEEKVVTDLSNDSLTIVSTISSSPATNEPQIAALNIVSASSKADMATQTSESVQNKQLSASVDSVNVCVSTEVNGISVDEAIITVNNNNQSSVPWSYSSLWPKYGLSDSTPVVCEREYSHAYNNNNGSFTGGELSSAQLLDKDLSRRKELKSRLDRKLDDLRAKEGSLNRDVEANESLGSQLLSKLKLCGISSQEFEKISLHSEEIEKVTRLLLSLRTRLKQIDIEMRAKNSAIFKRDGNDSMPEIKILHSKRTKLLSQLEEAIQLRDSIDRRSDLIAERILKKYFKDVNDDSLANFVEYLKLKAKLIVEIKEVKERIEITQKRIDAFE